MANYTRQDDFSARDALSSGNPDKLIVGADIDTELDAVAAAVATKADMASGHTTNNLARLASTGNPEDSGAAISTDGTLASNSDAKIPTEQAVKEYVGSYVDGQALGVGQTWQDVSGSRAFATGYTNSAGRSIAVSVSAVGSTTANTVMTITIDGVVVAEQSVALNTDGVAWGNVYAVIPSGAIYQIDVSVASTVRYWAELR